MTNEKHILIIDDDTDTCTLLANYLKRQGYKCEKAFSGKSGLEMLHSGSFDLVISDFRLGDMDGLELIRFLNEKAPGIPVIIITGYSDIRTAVNVMKGGAYDYVAKPLIPEEMLHLVRKALESRKEQDEMVAQPANIVKTAKDNYVKGKSALAKELERQIALVAPTQYSVIIYGETGSGKEFVARSIHQLSKRKDAPFVAVDCGALSRELAGSELFGHEKGAFTGALQSKTGHFEQANGGTLFLDEVGNLSYDIQVSLLRIIQERKLRKLGSNKEITLDVRILVASNEDLQAASRGGEFREDLYHRFNEFKLVVPALRERPEDIEAFAHYFLGRANEEIGRDIKGFDEEVMEVFRSYSWPGNIRELKNVIKRSALLTEGSSISIESLPLEISHPKFTGIEDTRPEARDAVSGNSSGLKDATQQAEYESILKALKQVNYNKSKAAQLLKIDRKTLYNKMKAYNLLDNQGGTA